MSARQISRICVIEIDISSSLFVAVGGVVGVFVVVGVVGDVVSNRLGVEAVVGLKMFDDSDFFFDDILNFSSGANVIKLFTAVIYKCLQ